MTFYVHARNLAVVLQDQNKSVVVHCVMGMNRSCTTIVLAQILSVSVKDVKKVVAYLKQVNKQTRLEVLENQAFVDNLVVRTFKRHDFEEPSHALRKLLSYKSLYTYLLLTF